MMPPDMRARVDAKHAELNPTWRNWDYYGMAPVRVIHVADREAPPDIHRPSVERLRAIGRITQERGKVAPVNPDPIAEMTCGEREYGQAPCLHCKQPFTKTGPSHHACSTACRKQIRNAYQRAYMKTLSPEKREAARGRRKRTVTSFGGAESASASNGSSGVGSAAARTPKEGEYGKQN
jgi:hypothetical protein